jgi:hypothetical protein
MQLTRLLLRRLRSEDGSTLVEMIVGAALAFAGLAMIGTFLISAMNNSAFAQGQSATLNDVRNAMQQIEKEVRGADDLVWCSPAGSCLQVGAQTVSGGFRTVRYTHAGTDLKREIFSDVSQTWSAPLTVIERVANSAGQKVFSCDTTSSLLKVTVDLHIMPTPNSNPLLNVQTSVRPRNFPMAASCP